MATSKLRANLSAEKEEKKNAKCNQNEIYKQTRSQCWMLPEALLPPKWGVKLLNTKVALKSRHSLLWRWMHGGLLLLTCMLYVASLQAYITQLHTCALSFPECSYIFILFPGTDYHICIIITHAAWGFVGLPWGPRWSLVIPSGC